MRATKLAGHAEVGAGRARRRRTPAHADLAKAKGEPPERISSRETLVSVEMDDYATLLARDPSAARRVRARVRRMVRGAALRYGGEVLREVRGTVDCLFPTELDGALAAVHTRAALSGDRGVGAKIVVHGPDSGGGTASAVARDLARPGDVLVLGDVGPRLSPFAELHTCRLGTYMIAGVPRPVLVTTLVARHEDRGEVAAWSAPWMARLARRGTVPSRANGAQK